MTIPNVIPTDQEIEVAKSAARLLGAELVVVCLGGLSVHTNGSPIFGCKVYGPFTQDGIEEAVRGIRQLEGGAVLIRPLCDLADTYRRISAD